MITCPVFCCLFWFSCSWTSYYLDYFLEFAALTLWVSPVYMYAGRNRSQVVTPYTLRVATVDDLLQIFLMHHRFLSCRRSTFSLAYLTTVCPYPRLCSLYLSLVRISFRVMVVKKGDLEFITWSVTTRCLPAWLFHASTELLRLQLSVPKSGTLPCEHLFLRDLRGLTQSRIVV